MHGWTGVAGELFTIGNGFIKNMFDVMIEKGDIQPLIIVAATVGTRDPIWEQVNNQLTEMLTRPVFSGGNARYAVKQGGRHNYDAIAEYVYNALPLDFKK